MTTAFVAALAGLLGIGLGAWLNSIFAIRRERWEFKREIYVRLLAHLHEASCILAIWVRFPQDDRFPKLEAEVEEIRKAHAIGALLLDEATSAAIHELSETWKSDDDAKDAEAFMRRRVQALGDAYRAVLQIARRDLGLSRQRDLS